MSDLPDPIGRALRGVDDAAVERGWRVVRDRQSRARLRTRRLVWLTAAAAVLVGCLVFWSSARHPTGGLRLKDGFEPAAMTGGDRGSETRFDDGSAVTLSPRSDASVLANSSTAFSMLVTRGHIDVDVVPGGPRRWVVECGLATVEVVGTRFSVDRDDNSVAVAVVHGIVVVRSDGLSPDHVRRLGAGESLRIERPIAPPPPILPATPTAPDPTASATLPPPPPDASSPTKRPKTWRELASDKDFAGAYGALGGAGIASESKAATVDELFALADVARMSGHPVDAVGPLRRVVSEHPSDRGSLAAFTLAKLELDALGRAADAADDFGRALALGLPSALREDAHVRRIEALVRAGRAAPAREAADAYRAAYPNSARQTEVTRWLEKAR